LAWRRNRTTIISSGPLENAPCRCAVFRSRRARYDHSQESACPRQAVYRELEQEGLLKLRHGVEAFVAAGGGTTRWTAARTGQMKAAQKAAKAFIHELQRRGIEPDEIRRLVEAELASHAGRVTLIG
jgi:hypothetical protein